MNWTVGAYVAYLLIAVPITVWVASTLSRNGRVFLDDVFDSNHDLADAINKLLVVGFYLVSLGFVTLFLTSHAEVPTAREVFELLSVKVGTVALILGGMHLTNVLVFNAIRRHHLAPKEAPRPATLPYGMPQVPPFPAP